jgi:flagellar assembly protein FliH
MTWTTDAFRSIDELPPIGSVFVDRSAQVAFDDAYQDGYAAGVAEGRARGESLGRVEATEAVRAESHAALDAVLAAADDLGRRDAAGLTTVAEFAVDLALALAETIVGREIDAAIDPGRDALVRALAVAPAEGNLVARLHPEDLAALGGVDHLVDGRDLRLVADPTIGRGGCVLDAGPSHIDATIGAAIARVRAELTGTASASTGESSVIPETSDAGDAL